MSPFMAKGTLQMCLIYESWEDCPILCTITRVLIRERQSETGLQQSRRQCRDRHRLQWCALKMGEGATRQEKQAATQSWKGQGNGFSSTRNQPCTVLSYEVWGNLLQQQQETNTITLRHYVFFHAHSLSCARRIFQSVYDMWYRNRLNTGAGVRSQVSSTETDIEEICKNV